MLQKNELEIISGLLLGDGCIVEDRRVLKNTTKSYTRLKLTAKDRRFLTWVSKLFVTPSIGKSITYNKENDTYSLYLKFDETRYLREKWYKKFNGKTIKVLPNDLN